jgi:hypothetical protein
MISQPMGSAMNSDCMQTGIGQQNLYVRSGGGVALANRLNFLGEGHTGFSRLSTARRRLPKGSDLPGREARPRRGRGAKDAPLKTGAETSDGAAAAFRLEKANGAETTQHRQSL